MTRTSLLRSLTASLAVAALVSAGLAVATSSASAVDPTGSTTAARAEARSALHAARTALDGRAGHPTRDATLALAELVRTRSALTGPASAEAARLLARPVGTQTQCTAENCYHWTTLGTDAVPAADTDADGTPDYVEQVEEVVDHVRATYEAAGYRTPEADGVKGGNAQTDIYLADVGSQGAYGYCTSDQSIPDAGPYDAWAFCVLDNDFSPEQFPTNDPTKNLEVTAAHEYFHAVQFAYDAFEDSWLMEATATWAEDELYTDVDDNLQYLVDSPLADPAVPLDTFIDGAGPQYGEWIFFRFLTEHITDAEGGLPVLIRDIWERADGSTGGPDDYSMQAVEAALKAAGYDLTDVFSAFAAANRFPALAYAEGRANDYPVARPAGTFKLSSARKDSGWKTAKVAHLAALTARFVPGSGLSASSWKLRVSVDLPNASVHPAAVVSIVSRSGDVTQKLVGINGKGDGAMTVGFGSSRVRYVEVTLVNAGRGYSCWTGGGYSCNGTPKDDGRKLLVRATAVR